MKYIKKRNQWEANNVTFNPDTIVATSYGWWNFVQVIKGNVVFNRFNYSITTCKHQSKVRSLLRELGIKIDREVNFKRELNNILSIKELNETQKKQDKLNLEIAEQKRLARNANAKRKREVKKLIEATFDQAAFRDYSFSSSYVPNSIRFNVWCSDNNESIQKNSIEAVSDFVTKGASSITVTLK